MSETDKIKWIHLSDLHFGYEEEIGGTSNIRDGLIKFLDSVKDNKFKYLFISGDIFYGLNFYKKEKKDRNIIIDNAIVFILKVIHKLGIKRENVFIVPGNHDTNREIKDREKSIIKEECVKTIKENYRKTDKLDVTELKKFQKYFNQFCERINKVELISENQIYRLIEKDDLNNINFCDSGHKLIEKEDIDVLMLNSSLSSCKDDEKLLLGQELLETEIKKIFPYHFEDESFPLFVLSHHDPHCFEDDDKEKLCKCLKEKNGLVLYLCGHKHRANTEELKYATILTCGTHEKKEIKDNYKPNEVSFLTGLFDKTLSETKISYYKYHYGKWMPNRDKSDNVPHNVEIFEYNTYKKDLFISKSESEAVNNFFTYIFKTLEPDTKKKTPDYQYRYFKNKINEVLDFIANINSAWKFHEEFRTKFNKRNNIEDLLKTIREEADNYEDVRNSINDKKHILKKKIDNKIKEKIDNKDIGILLYSKSKRVTDYLLELLKNEKNYKHNIVIYICSGDIRSKNNLYLDGLDIASELYDYRTKKIKNIKEVRLIPDIYVDILMKRGKINFVMMGAHSLHYEIDKFTHFNNTVGSNLIIDLAIKYKVECLIIAEISKADNSCPIFNSHIYKNFEIVDSFTYSPIDDDTSYFQAKFHHYESVDIIENQENGLISVITDLETDIYPWTNRPKLEPNTIQLFTDKISKDRRKLKLSENTTEIKKYFLPEDKELESIILTKLSESKNKYGFIVPVIKEKTKDYVNISYYKGIRIFNLIISIENLKNKYEPHSREYSQLDTIVKNLLNRCEENQKNIQLELYKNKNFFGIVQKYPKEKLTDIIDLLFLCINNLDNEIDKSKIIYEMNWVYEIFEKNATVPFRDASTRNMILENEDLYLEKFNGNENERNTFIEKLFREEKLETIIESSNIIDIDFSSCNHLTTPYDDTISFRFHERTEPYFTFENFEVWNRELNDDLVNNEVLVATFIVRFLRFGGRKLLYRIIARELHSKRFKHDDEFYYFRKLQEIICENKITCLQESNKLFKKIEEVTTKDFYLLPYLDRENILEKINIINKKPSYADVFPY